MKKMTALALLLCTICTFRLSAQHNYWQQEVNYTLDVSLNDKEKSITGSETILYKNNSPSTLGFIWFHLWPNAYRSDSTALMQQLANDSERKKKLGKVTRGSIEGLRFSVNGQDLVTESHPNPAYVDVVKLVLPAPLKPGDSVKISTPFKVLLPNYFSRSGYADGEFMACQWYPKPAVFDKDGWHEFPYLDMGEFYSEYGKYDVKITLPSAYVVGATGELQSSEELAAYKSIGAKNHATRNARPSLYSTVSASPTKTLHYRADNVPDFAWFADKEFVIHYDTLQTPGGKVIDAFSYYHNKRGTIWSNSMDYIKDGLRKYSTWIGDYEYPVVQVVEGPKNNSSGGMEYPMITLITSPDAKDETLDAVITHEVGHNWFMSMLGSNERAHTWMDEGLNTFYQFRYEAEKYRANSVFGESLPSALKSLPAEQFLELVYESLQQIPMEAAMETPANKFSNSQEYGLTSYVKTAMWMYLLESRVGRDKVDAAVKNYFIKWKHRHPQPSDMQAAFEEAIGANLDKFFALVNKQGALK